MQTSLLVATLATALVACATGPRAPLGADTPPMVAEAPQPLWGEIFGRLARRADRGDAESARLALEMHRVAPWAYGTTFDATPAQLHAWRCRAAGREAPCAAGAPLA
jgi:hypothetical protein